MRRVFSLLLASVAIAAISPRALAAAPRDASPPSGPVIVLELDGAIGPATADHVSRGIARATMDGAQLVLLRIDTPGGLDKSMRQIVKAILGSEVPVAVFVGPSGARAASAGTFILYASHIAAMAPGTNLGAATPVRVGTGMASSPAAPSAEKDGGKDEDARAGTDMDRKQVNDAAAFIRGLAQLRGRDAEFAERAVRHGASLPSSEALERKVIEYIADDVPALLRKLDGARIGMGSTTRTLSTAGATVVSPVPDVRTRALSVIADPSVALILMMIGMYGLFFEFMSPGFGVAGVLGAISLLLGLYALHLLPVSYLGLGLVLLGVALMVSEAFTPSFGILGAGGLVAFVAGAALLVDTPLAAFRIPAWLIVGVAAMSALLLGVVGRIAWNDRKRAAASGAEEMIGAIGEVLRGTGGVAWARVHGEIWRVASPAPLQPGDRVRVRARDGLVLEVETVERQTKGE